MNNSTAYRRAKVSGTIDGAYLTNQGFNLGASASGGGSSSNSATCGAYSLWSATTSYQNANEAYYTADLRVYRSLQNSNRDNTPPGSTYDWVYLQVCP